MTPNNRVSEIDAGESEKILAYTIDLEDGPYLYAAVLSR